MDIFFILQMIYLDTENVICPMPSAQQVFPISNCIVTDVQYNMIGTT